MSPNGPMSSSSSNHEMNSGAQVFILLNGPFNKPQDLPSQPPEGSLVLAVDGGAVHGLSLNWPIDILLGDFDSLSPRVMSVVKERHPSVDIRTFPRDKDETDFELALRLVDPMAAKLSKVTILGGLGGRWDMTLANLMSPLASSLQFLTIPPPKPDVIFRDGGWSLHLAVGPSELHLGPAPEARRVSLIPLRGHVAGASLKGAFKYPLENGVLKEGFTLGLSNELGPQGGSISIESGVLLASVSPLSDEGFTRPEPNF